MTLLRLPSSPFLCFVRTAKRRGVKAQRLMKEKRQTGGAEGKKVEQVKSKGRSFRSRRDATQISVVSQYPPLPLRLVKRKEKPADDVWLKAAYVRPVYSIAEAIEMHRELQHPTMFNNVAAPVVLRLDLNMELEKKNHYLESTSKLILMPHTFHHDQKRTILAFVKNPDLQISALEAGAEIAGGPELVKKVSC
ncbi:unnamed protein product [Soboliphyme baturini]|uniref:DUF1336 domain-containing protein n=1 Tax=Soboliphyme baturini TaxID=241478 RepID=A0A183IIG7_9BILA|nr:unnamed protein product [Soboliphyme baturini]